MCKNKSNDNYKFKKGLYNVYTSVYGENDDEFWYYKI